MDGNGKPAIINHKEELSCFFSHLKEIKDSSLSADN